MLIIDDVQIIINSVYERELREEILEKKAQSRITGKSGLILILFQVRPISRRIFIQ